VLCLAAATAYLLWMLVGRQTEQEQIQRLLADAREGRGRALVLRGEAGVGKTALLEHAVEAATGFRHLHALGVESEAELPFAALDELVRPVLDLLDELPQPQANAIKAALALAEIENAERFSAYAAALGLFSAAAAQQPLLCVVDDAHWLDQASAEALVFAARRLDYDAVAMLFAVRDPAPASFSTPGLAELRLRGLTADQAKTLLATTAPTLAPAELDRLVKAAGGNPLALLEFAPGVAASTVSGAPLPVSEVVERAFLERASRLSADARRALLLVAVSGSDSPDVLWTALELERISADSLGEAERAGLIVQGRRLDFSHPLARSAIYHGAPPADRRAAHRAIAASTTEPDRGAWHEAMAATAPNEEVAAALDEAAAKARARGGLSAEAAALERAARLTPDAEVRARRLFRAGLAADACARFDQAEELFAEASALTSDAELRADAVARRSYLVFDRGDFEAAIELANSEAEHAAPATAARLLTSSGVIHALIHALDIPAARRTAERAAELAGDEEAADDPDIRHMLAWAWELSGLREQALELIRECAGRVEVGTVLAVDVANRFLFLEDYDSAQKLFDRVIEYDREVGALQFLGYALDMRSLLDARTGRLAPAYALALEALQLTESLGTDTATAACLARLAHLEAVLGRSAGAIEHGRRSLQISEKRGDRWNIVRARSALGLEALARGDAAGTVTWLAPAAEMLASGGHRLRNNFRLDGDLIEAYVRLGEKREAEQKLADLLEHAEESRSPWALAVGARCRALVAEEGDVDEAFTAALKLHASEPSAWERARTELAYGERLRRRRQPRAAREQLHAALTGFERLGSKPWADRARAELHASGERLRRRRDPAAHDQLTPQELQVSLAAADGLTSKEIGARLFLSPKTVDFHLGRAYRKLDVRSRAELIKLFAQQATGAERPLA
jgi:DNA-binding CsgD family transcriptional regulator